MAVASRRSRGKPRSPARFIARVIPGSKPGPFPLFIPPCLAATREKPPAGDQWLHEIKFDGHRAQLHARDGYAVIYSRGGHDWTNRFRSIAEAAWHLEAHQAVLDGECIVP